MNFSTIQIPGVGDVTPDRSVRCGMDGIAPAAPDPRLRGTREMPGGAGSVAANSTFSQAAGPDVAQAAGRRLLPASLVPAVSATGIATRMRRLKVPE